MEPGLVLEGEDAAAAWEDEAAAGGWGCGCGVDEEEGVGGGPDLPQPGKPTLRNMLDIFGDLIWDMDIGLLYGGDWGRWRRLEGRGGAGCLSGG